LQARLQQQAEKERRLGEQAKFERDEFERIIEAGIGSIWIVDFKLTDVLFHLRCL
jgi:hypothetical protein